jgi:large subunit ribosomal protein L3
MSGLIGKKLGMTSVFDDAGNHIAVTVIEIEPNIVTQIKTEESDGYTAVQLASVEKKAKSSTKALRGIAEKANTTPKKYFIEFRDFMPDGVKVGDSLTASDVFTEGTQVDIVGTSKGKGFQGVVKRHGFKGVGGRTHGQHNRERAPGSVGQASDPSRVFKGVRMGGRTGNERVKHKNSRVVRILADSNLLLVQGSVPGPAGRVVQIHNRA